MVDQNTHSMMNHGAMLWAAAAYNNGAFFLKNPLFGQDYNSVGEPLALLSPIHRDAGGHAHQGLPARDRTSPAFRDRPAGKYLPRV